MSEEDTQQEATLAATSEPRGASSAPVVWPLLLIVSAMLAALVVPARVAPGTPYHFLGLIFGSLIGVLLVCVWWLTRSRVSLTERFVGFGLVAALLLVSSLLVFDPSLVGLPLLGYVLPSVCVALVPLFALARVVGWRSGRVLIASGLIAVCAGWSLLRAEGVDGNISVSYAPRWQSTAEEVFLAQAEEPQGVMAEVISIESGPGDWVGFRGPARDGVLRGVSIGSDWSTPPSELWRRKVGPGWGSFTFVGDYLFTQEQRGAQEVVACYHALTGEQVWVNAVTARFEESAAGPGPRATPTFHEGRLYTTGASGVVQCLEAATGAEVWRRNLVDDTSNQLLIDASWWGFASSPLIVAAGDDTGGDATEERSLAVVYAGTQRETAGDTYSVNDSVIAYDIANGEVAWTSGVGTHGYASAHRASFGGSEQVLVSSNAGLESLDPATGERLWLYEWSSDAYARIVQPTLLPDDRVLLAAGYGLGSHVISVAKQGDAWATTTEWESRKLKPYFNDTVYYEGHLYGFDGKFFTCLDAATSKVTWPRSVKRKAQFGHGQALLIEDSGLILIVTEDSGEVVLIEANPETLVVKGRFQALGDKTWNHPVIHKGKLYVRNGVEMACFELPMVSTGLAAAPQ